jgi:LysM repeat protein
VVAGDYVETIAKLFGITVDELVTANGLSVNNVLSVGQKLLIPTLPAPTAAPDNTPQEDTPTVTPEPVYVTVVHVVQQGETIDTIAAQYGVTWEVIAEANGIGKDTILAIGQELTIPTMAVAPEATTGPTATTSSTSEPAQTAEPTTSTPAQVTYIVSTGDYIESIAEHFGITADQLAEANGITIDTVLQVGQELEIPNQTATTEPTSTPTVTPASTSTAVPRDLPTVRSTLTDTTSFTYQQPLLLAPVNDSVFEGADASILLNWISVGILTSNEWYQVRIWKADAQDAPLIYYTKTTSWRPPLGFYNSESAPYTIRWQVVVVDSVTADNAFDMKSPASAMYSFYWR